MKKKLMSLLLAATALTAAFGLAACGEDDGKDKTPDGPGNNDGPAAPTTYTVTYDLNGGTATPALTGGSYAAGAEFDLAPTDGINKANNAFTGWLCNADSVTYNADAKFTMPSKDVTFTAQWASCTVDSAAAWKSAFDFTGVTNAKITLDGVEGGIIVNEYDGDKTHSTYEEKVTEGVGAKEDQYVEHKPDEIYDPEDDPTRGTTYLYEYDFETEKWGVRTFSLRTDGGIEVDVERNVCRFSAVYNEDTEENEGKLDERFNDFEYDEQKHAYVYKHDVIGYYDTDVEVIVSFRNGKLYDCIIKGSYVDEDETYTIDRHIYIENIGTTEVTIPTVE